MDIPAPLTYGTITGHFISVVGDSTDVGAAPDVVTLSGTVSITPNVSQFRIIGPPVQLAVATTVTGTIIDGELLTADGTPLTVLASDTPGIDPSPIQYTAQFNLTGVKQQPKPVTFEVPGNGTIDIGSIVALPTAPPVQTIVSETSRIAAESAATRAESAAQAAEAAGVGTIRAETADPNWAVADANDAPPGYSLVQSGGANRPPDGSAQTFVLLTLYYDGWGAPYRFQSAVREGDGLTYTRFFYDTTWSGWAGAGLTPLDSNGPAFSPGNNYWLDMDGRGIYSLAAPVQPDHAANKGYVDSRHVALTQTEYDALATKDPNVLYLITA